MILLRPEVTLRHDGRREAEDWPSLLVAYGSGDGAFYMKHVRCRDPYAHVAVHQAVRRHGRPLGRQDCSCAGRPNNYYLRGHAPRGSGSFKFEVDRATRLYVER